MMSALNISNSGGSKTLPNYSRAPTDFSWAWKEKTWGKGWKKQPACKQLLGASGSPGWLGVPWLSRTGGEPVANTCFQAQILSFPLRGDIFAAIVSCTDKNECQNDHQVILDVHYRVISLYRSPG